MYADETGVEVVVETTPWPDFQTKTFTELAAKGSSFDIVVGDSQWLGAGVKGGHYVEMTDFFAKHGVDKSMTAGTVTAYADGMDPSHSHLRPLAVANKNARMASGDVVQLGPGLRDVQFYKSLYQFRARAEFPGDINPV